MRDTPTDVMIFAAGFGTRMLPLTRNTPKPLLGVGDTTLLDHTLALAQDAGLTNRVVNAHYHADQISAHLAGMAEQVVVEDPILDTGGGLKNAAPFFDNPHVFTSNSDAIWAGPNPFTILADGWDTTVDAMLLCVPIDRALGRIPPGDFVVNAAGSLQRGPDLVYTGIQIIRLELVSRFPETTFSLNKIWDPLIAQGRLKAAIYPGKWCDVGRPENLELAASLMGDTDV